MPVVPHYNGLVGADFRPPGPGAHPPRSRRIVAVARVAAFHSVGGAFWRQLGVVVKKGRHRRFEEARSLKRSVATGTERCPECGAEPEDVHTSWCRAEEDSYDRILGSSVPGWEHGSVDEHDPLDD